MNVRPFWKSPHFVPLLFLFALCSFYWNRVLFSNQVLLPDFGRGFAPFGSDPKAPWNILQWDSLAQYFPWRTFSAQQVHAGKIPLWNPHQFAGTPFLANGQSAVFYPLSLPFYLFDVARAFGVSAWLHSLLACFATYFLGQQWRLSRAASLLAAVAFGFCGFLTFWITLPTLSNTASWLPLLVLLFERAVASRSETTKNEKTKTAATNTRFRGLDFWLLVIALGCAYLAGHPQIFFYCLVALVLRALTFPLVQWKNALAIFVPAVVATLFGCALQILPTLELARLGHRAGQVADAKGWAFVSGNALHSGDLMSLTNPFWPSLSFNENKGYVGVGVLTLMLAAIVFAFINRFFLANRKIAESSTRNDASGFWFAFILTLFGLLYALASPLSAAFYFHVPAIAQMGGVGRALCLWSLGASLLAGFGLDALRARIRSSVLPLLALGVVAAELFAASWNTQPTAPRADIYPATRVTTFLQEHTQNGERVLFWTPRKDWLPREILIQESQDSGVPEAARTHPEGILPPNGATVYGLNDVNGYDSLSSGAYRQFLNQGEGVDVSPPLNGNMVLINNVGSPALDALDVRYIVVPELMPVPNAREVLRTEGCVVFERQRVLDVSHIVTQKSGRDFFPGWTNNQYNPTSFRLGSFLSLLILGLMSACFGARIASKRARFSTTN